MIKNSSFAIAVAGVPQSGKTHVKHLIDQNQVKKPLFEVSEVSCGYLLNPSLPDFGEAYKNLVVGEMNYGTRWQGFVLCLDARKIADQLFLVSQVLDLRKPVLIVLNFVESAREMGLKVKVDQFETMLDCPTIILGNDDDGNHLVEKLEELLADNRKKWILRFDLCQCFRK